MTFQISKDTLVVLASLYEELEYSPELSPKVLRAKLVFRSECRRLYETAPRQLRDKMDLDEFTAAIVIPDVLRQIQSPPPPASI